MLMDVYFRILYHYDDFIILTLINFIQKWQQ